MTISTTKLVDDTFKVIVDSTGLGNENEQVLISANDLLGASSEPKLSIANIHYEIEGDGNVTIFFENDNNKSVVISGRGNYGLKPGEIKIKDPIGNILLSSDENVIDYNVVIESHKESGFTS
jgi:hypothetical protein